VSNVLVTGGAGYIGAILVQDLLAEGHRVSVLDNFIYRQNSLSHLISNENLEVVVGDIRDLDLVKDLLHQKDIVIPLAAIVGAPACNRDPFAAESINLRAAIELIKNCDPSQLIIMPTTNSAYGTTVAGTVTTEESPLNPISSYARHKVEVEEKLLSHKKSISFRLATVFGMSPRMRLDLLVNDLVNKALNDKSVVLFEPHFVRNYVHVRDVSGAIRWAMGLNIQTPEIFNVGLSQANLSKFELCNLISKYIPEFDFLISDFGKDPDQRNYFVSNEKIESSGFKFNYTLEAGIAELIRGLKPLRNQVYGNI
jgi:nucleoside-diphosphate-sugar epimerase